MVPLNCCVQEKAEAKERERIKEEVRKGKKLETAFRNLLNERNVSEESAWEDVRGKVEGEPAFEAITQEYERVRIFKEFVKVNMQYRSSVHSTPGLGSVQSQFSKLTVFCGIWFS